MGVEELIAEVVSGIETAPLSAAGEGAASAAVAACGGAADTVFLLAKLQSVIPSAIDAPTALLRKILRRLTSAPAILRQMSMMIPSTVLAAALHHTARSQRPSSVRRRIRWDRACEHSPVTARRNFSSTSVFSLSARGSSSM